MIITRLLTFAKKMKDGVELYQILVVVINQEETLNHVVKTMTVYIGMKII